MTLLRTGVAVTLCISFIAANPSGHNVAHGQADVRALQNLLQITTSDKAIINWKEFSSSSGELIQFVQPSRNSAVLNRVVGKNTTTLYGDLKANGQVYLVNPNGIVIGQNARIDAGAFTASTFDVLDADFIEGSALKLFGDSKAGVVNLGTIKTNSGDCTLIGFQVDNDGAIEASGQASLIASNKVILKPHDLQRIYIASNQDAPYADNPYLLAFNQTIEKDALCFAKTEEGVFLTMDAPVATVAGSIEADSTLVLGNFIQLLGDATIDVSSDMGGGTILIGGDFQGKNDTLLNAGRVYLAPKTQLHADALVQGSGGEVIVWSDEATRFYGKLSAEGGPLGGDGGLIEVSGGELVFRGKASTFAPMGQTGTLLLDPIGFTITAAATVNMTSPPPAAFTTSSPTGAGANLFNTDLQTALGSNSVVLSTTAGVGAPQSVSITSAVNWAANNSLTILSHNDINCLNDVTGGGTICFVAGWDGTTPASSFLNGTFGPASYGQAHDTPGDLFIDNSATQGVQVVSASGSALLFGHDVQILASNNPFPDVSTQVFANAAGQRVQINATQDIITRSGTTGGGISAFIQANNGTITFNAARDIDVRAGQPATSDNDMTIQCLGPITFTAGHDIIGMSGAENFSNLFIQTTGAQDVNFTAQRDIAIGTAFPPPVGYMGGDYFIRSLGNGNVNFSAPNGKISCYSVTGALVRGEIGSTTLTHNVTFTTRDEIHIESVGNTPPSNGAINVFAANAITFTTTSAAGVINMIGSNQLGAFGASAVVQTASGPIVFNAKDINMIAGVGGGASHTASVTSTSGNITFNATGNVVMNGGTGSSSDAEIRTQSGSIALNIPSGFLQMIAFPTDSGGCNITTTPGTGTIQITLGSDLTMSGGGQSAEANIQSNSGDITLTIPGNLSMTGGSGVGNDPFAAIQSSSGTVTVNTTGDITMTSAAASLGSATRISSTSGPVIVKGRNLSMQAGTSNFSESIIRSQTGLINVTLTGNLTMTGGGAILDYAQIGWRTSGVQSATAPITIDVAGTALLQAGPGSFNIEPYVQIGHGGGSVAPANTGSVNAPITVTVRNNGGAATALTLLGGGAVAGAGTSYAQIGHGGCGGVGANFTTIAGNVNVTISQGNVRMRGGNINSPAWIGHGAMASTVNTVIGGDVVVNVQNGNLNVDRPVLATSTFSPAGVFHVGPTIDPSTSITANISGNLLLDGATTTSLAFIGAYAQSGTNGASVVIDCPVVVCVGGDIFLGGTDSSGNSGGAAGIGHNTLGPFVGGGTVTLASCASDVMVQSVGNTTLAPLLTGVSTGQDIAFIGTPNTVLLGAGPFTARTFLVVRGASGLTLNGNVNGVDLATSNAEVYGLADANIAVVNNILCRGGDTASRLGSRLQSPLSTARIWAGGDIIFQNSNSGGLGRLGSTGLAGQGGNLDVRAAGDVRLSSSTTQSAAAASIFVQGGTAFASAALFNSFLTLIDGQTASGFSCASSTSPVIGPDGPNNLGTVRIDTAGYDPTGMLITPAMPPGIVLTTIDGDITVNSADRFQTSDPNYGIVAGTFSDLTFAGPGTNALVLNSTTGDITVSGPSPTDSFHDINVNTVPAPWTAGNIYISANNNQTVNSTISTSGLGSSITLIADQNDTNVDGPGILTINADITTNAGPILLDAGFGSSGGISSINQVAAVVDSTGGAIRTQAVGDITINGNAVSMTSAGGNQSMQSTVGNIYFDQDLSATSGSISITADAGSIFGQLTGSVQTSSGAINLTAGSNITLNGDATTLLSTTGAISTLAGIDTFVTTNVATAGPVLMITGRNMFLQAATTSIASSASSVTLVTDNDFPSPPGIGPGFFSSVADSSVTAAAGLRVFTALQGQNSILGKLNGATFAAGTIFNDSATERWCVYYPDSFFGGVFTVFYKDCQNIIATAGNRVVSDMLFNLASENMWVEELLSPLVPPEIWRFMFIYDKGVNSLTHFAHERYWLSRRSIHFIHYPYVYKENRPLERLVPSEAILK